MGRFCFKKRRPHRIVPRMLAKGAGDTKDVTIDDAGNSGVAREFRSVFFRSVAAFWRPWERQGSSKRGPGTPKAAKRSSKVSPDGSKSGAKDVIFRNWRNLDFL